MSPSRDQGSGKAEDGGCAERSVGAVSGRPPEAATFPADAQFSISLPSAWDEVLGHPFEREPYRRTLAAAEAASALETVYPPREDWFAAFRLTPPERVRAVILGQDPYHEPNQAMGLAFSVGAGVKLPPSLRNIYKELESDLGVSAPASGDLTPWAEQGVLLLNTVLTVAAGRANSHKNLGWQSFTDAVIAALSRLPQPIAFVLWGAPAQSAFENAACGLGKRQQAAGNRGRETAPAAAHTAALRDVPAQSNQELAVEQCSSRQAGPRLILTAPHPSPLSAYRGFFGNKPFSQINDFLQAHGEAPIRWVK